MALDKFPDYSVDYLVKESTKQPSLRPLPVRYRGYWFRSRLEGRWAVFLDEMGIEFQYEPLGFQLPNGVCYLPDFYLPKVRCYAEVKPQELTPEQRESCQLLVYETNASFLFLIGPPDFRAYEAFWMDSGQITEDWVSLDIHTYRKAYFTESRLWSVSEIWLDEEDHSLEYIMAVHESRGCRFENMHSARR